MKNPIYLLILLLILMSCNERKNDVNKGKPILKITNGNHDSFSQKEKDEMNDMKKLLPKSHADTLIFKTREEYEKWKESNENKKLNH